jgi:glyoxylase-like metal-dependent hydrolase (beta-lactamase superfamily II)
VLIDAGMDSTGQDMLLALEKLSLKVEQVKAILLTHWHNDHAAGARVIKEASGAATHYHRADEPYLTRRTAHAGLRDRLANWIPELGPLVLFKGLLGEASPEAVSATSFVAGGEIIHGDLEVIFSPGHTDGHISFYSRQHRALFAGDALAVVNGRLRFMSGPVTPDKVRARESMTTCLDRDIKIICPGHREPLTKNTAVECKRLLELIASNKAWPIFG